MKVQSLLFLQHSHPAKVERKRCRVTVGSCMMLRESAATTAQPSSRDPCLPPPPTLSLSRAVPMMGTSTVARAEFPVQAAAGAATSIAGGSAGIGLRRALRRWLLAAVVDLMLVQIHREVALGRPAAHRRVGEGRLEVILDRRSGGCVRLHSAASHGSHQLRSWVVPLSVKIMSTSVMANDDGIALMPFSCPDIVVVVCVTSLGLLRENSRVGSLRSVDVDVFDVVFPPWGIVLERVLAEVAKRWSYLGSTASTTASFSPWRNGVLAIDKRSVVELSCIMVASTTVGPSKVNMLIPSKDGTKEDGGDSGFRVCACYVC
ncbi:uncharacterized protein LOC119307882 isoform X1 [Triticum dicoccoides]|uniref:uncharacterized protein LOC119307882 isoform X1 n=1 Tax=Triticum dicoccoides TaxID=85692 RepID=UPI00188E29F8|nr:uncharacterized protein LOC119307882 isoform X1 [Triticum dicoccoides]